MQAIKDKINEMKQMHEVSAEAKEQEKAEKDLAKARVKVAHEVRLAKEAEAKMDIHVARAAEKAAEFESKHPDHMQKTHGDHSTQDPYGHNPANPGSTGYTTDQGYGAKDPNYGHHSTHPASNTQLGRSNTTHAPKDKMI